jgi:hypothetical protein
MMPLLYQRAPVGAITKYSMLAVKKSHDLLLPTGPSIRYLSRQPRMANVSMEATSRSMESITVTRGHDAGTSTPIPGCEIRSRYWLRGT